ncbi:hypothetical protein Q1695_011970 [Nippostrongylus brasiliensis]|nr:hypothetical protein Q1695_011970 [Nippostrongylus brasiliensis]
MFVNIAGTSHRALSRSHFSEEEADVCVSLARRLLSVGVSSTGICVITFYKEQNRRLAPLLRDLGISLATVDSIQGREMDVVIVLTTKTAFATEAGRSRRRTLRSGGRPGATTRSGGRGRRTNVRRSLIPVRTIHTTMDGDDLCLEPSDDPPKCVPSYSFLYCGFVRFERIMVWSLRPKKMCVN